MASPEKIEELLQNFGQTLEDLPKPDNGYATYSLDDLHDAYHRAMNWREKPHMEGWVFEDFICHQSEVVERLVKALETASAKWIQRERAVGALRAIKHGLWEIDIPQPGNCPEYVEHHKQIQEMMGVVDNWITIISREDG